MHEKRVKEHVREKTEGLCRICDKLEEWVECEMTKGSEEANAVGLGMVTDMLKDVCEAKEKVVKACYYEELMETMEEDSEFEKEERQERKKMRTDGRMYFPVDVQGSNSGSAVQRGFPGPYDPNRGWPGDNIRMDGISWTTPGVSSMKGAKGTGGRRGFSFDNYEEALEMYSQDDPESKRMRMESLNRDLHELVEMSKEVAAKLSPEEKQMWKSQISKILNA